MVAPALVEFFEELIQARLLIFTEHLSDLLPGLAPDLFILRTHLFGECSEPLPAIGDYCLQFRFLRRIEGQRLSQFLSEVMRVGWSASIPSDGSARMTRVEVIP